MMENVVSEQEAAKLLNMRAGTLCKWRCRRRGPVFMKIGGKVAYRTVDIQEWLESCRIDPSKLAPAKRKHSKKRKAA